MPTSELMRAALALVFVVGIMWALKLILERINMKQYGLTKAKTKNRRLEIIESLAIAPQKRLLLIRRDKTEHLILASQTSDVVIETNIKTRKD